MEARATRRGPTEGSHQIGVDGPGQRPGVPMEARPEEPADGAAWAEPPRQAGTERHLHRKGLDRPTPVVGSGQPPHGVSGLIRRAAYGIPEHYARHWMLLLVADRVDTLEDRLGETLARPMQQAGFESGARHARRNPVAVLAGAAVGAALVRKLV